MKYHFYANFNVLGGFFVPGVVTEKVDPEEMKDAYVQVVAGLPQEALLALKECDLYCLGSFDNVSGEIVPDKQFILHCGEVTSRFIKCDEVKEDGSEEEYATC